jgi:hypothetical protein
MVLRYTVVKGMEMLPSQRTLRVVVVTARVCECGV